VSHGEPTPTFCVGELYAVMLVPSAAAPGQHQHNQPNHAERAAARTPADGKVNGCLRGKQARITITGAGTQLDSWTYTVGIGSNNGGVWCPPRLRRSAVRREPGLSH